MGTSGKSSCKTAAVLNLLSKSAVPVPNLGTNAGGREQIEYIDIDRIDDDPNNFYELSGLDELAANIELLGLQQPIRVRPGEEQGRYIIVSGHRRRAAVRQLVMDGHGELRDLPCIVEREQGSAALQELRLIYANSDTRKMSAAEISKQAERVEALLYQLKEEGYEFPGRMRDYVAEACKVSKSKLARLKVIREKLGKPWKTPYEKGKLSEAAAYTLAQMPEERQQVIWEGMAKKGEAPGSAQEWVVKDYGDKLAKVEKIECKTWGHGPCLNRDAMRERVMARSRYEYSYCRQCCEKCEKLTSCKQACPLLAEKVKQLKADAKAQKEREKQVREERDRLESESIKEIWRRFGESRAAAGCSIETFLVASGLDLDDEDIAEYDRLEHLDAKFDSDTELPYGHYLDIEDVRSLIIAADQFGVSLDYLLCRTDAPAGFAPQPEGQLVISGWMPGGTSPFQPCDVVADFDLGGGVLTRMACQFDGSRFRLEREGQILNWVVVRWMVLPPVEENVSELDTGRE